MRPQLTPVGGKICRGGQLLPVLFRYWLTGPARETPVLLGFLARHFLGTPLAEKHA
jgi:hypothetical protein